MCLKAESAWRKRPRPRHDLTAAEKASEKAKRVGRVAFKPQRPFRRGLVLVNPATSFDRTVWPLLGRLLAALPNEPDRLPALGEHDSLKELFEDIQERAQQSPYPYIAGSARGL